MKIAEFDVIFLSYDEPNAELNWADLCNKIPWAKRVHGVKGSDAAHKAAAEMSETEWFVSVDADNIVYPEFFDQDIQTDNQGIRVYCWAGYNIINGLRYGNGGLKLWHRDFVLGMKTHEDAVDPRAQVDFCWETGYCTIPRCYSDTIINGSAFQAWRAGFREGVKMTLHDGIKVKPDEIRTKVWWHNIHRLNVWATIGSHEQNGLFSILGTRMGTYMTNCTEWDFLQVRDFQYLYELYDEKVKKIENDDQELINTIIDLGEKIQLNLGFNWPYLEHNLSKYTLNLYKETLKLNETYYKHI